VTFGPKRSIEEITTMFLGGCFITKTAKGGVQGSVSSGDIPKADNKGEGGARGEPQ